MNFNELNLSPELLRAVEDMGYTQTTSIQEKTIPVMLQGLDLIGQSQTGTGKTAAFGLPLIQSIVPSDKKRPQALIMCPTRELSIQVAEELRKFAKYTEGVRTVTIYGGQPISVQIRELKSGADIIVGTPGRIKDHIDRHTLKFEDLKVLVLDEADEMLNMGFREEIEDILSYLPQERQTVMFSATMPQPILNLTEAYMKDPEFIKIKTSEMTVSTIEQILYETNQGTKQDLLLQLLEIYRPELSMVFCNTKKMVDDIASLLLSKGYGAAAIHGDMKQEMRSIVMAKFKDRKINILVCTDVAARGIDVDDMDIVFNFDLPQEIEYYVHRIGRTGRAGKTGIAISLITPRQKYLVNVLERLTRAKINKKPLPTLAEVQEIKFHQMKTEMRKLLAKEVPDEIKRIVEELVDEGFSLEEISRALLFKTIGGDVFKEIKSPASLQKVVTHKGYSNLTLDVGNAHGIAAAHIVSCIAEASGISGRDIGKIRIGERTTTVEIPVQHDKAILEEVNKATIKGYTIKAVLSHVVDRPYEKRTYGGSGSYDRNRDFGNRSKGPRRSNYTEKN